MTDTVLLRIDVDDSDADDEDRARLARRLRDALLDLDVDAVQEASTGPAPDGSKGVEMVEAGALLVSLAPALLASVTDLVRRWLGDRGTRTVRMSVDGNSIEVSGVSSADEERLVEDWLHRGRPTAGADPS